MGDSLVRHAYTAMRLAVRDRALRWKCKEMWRYLKPRTTSRLSLLLVTLASICLLLMATISSRFNPYHSRVDSLYDRFELGQNASDTRPPLSAPGWCPERLNGMLQGYWEPSVMTVDDVQRMKTFHTDVRQGQYKLPTGLQREDKRCGNLTFDPLPDLHVDMFRALCDPEGDTPCCDRSNTCVARTVEECRCDGCWDMRTELHAEYATWRTAQPGCELQDMTAGELCDLLEGGTFFFMGDSLVRHVYTAMLLAVRDNDDTGAYAEGMSQEFQKQCMNLYMFPGHKSCRLDMDRVVHACRNTVLLRQFNTLHNHEGPDIRAEITTLKNKIRSVVFIGLGFHGNFKAHETFEQVMRPLLEQMRQEDWRWPLIVWASVHSFGPLKSPSMKGQLNPDLIRFNRQMEEWLVPYTAWLPLYVFNTFNLTVSVASFDGVHYGLGVNKVKVKVLANFLRRLRHEGVW